MGQILTVLTLLVVVYGFYLDRIRDKKSDVQLMKRPSADNEIPNRDKDTGYPLEFVFLFKLVNDGEEDALPHEAHIENITLKNVDGKETVVPPKSIQISDSDVELRLASGTRISPGPYRNFPVHVDVSDQNQHSGEIWEEYDKAEFTFGIDIEDSRDELYTREVKGELLL